MSGVMTKPSHVRFNILVVDDDSTSLNITAAVLRQWDYDVVSVKRPVEAADIVRFKGNIDLVVSDLHMPEKNGLELQKEINEEFPQLPVMILSSDDRECMIMKALASGVVLYIVKPLSKIDLKNVWQYAYAYKRSRSMFTEQIGSFELDDDHDDDDDSDGHVASAASSVNGAGMMKKKRRACSKTAKVSKAAKKSKAISSAPKKVKVAWTNSLHNRFLQAIRHIGLEKAVPKKILEFMNVPGLTRENVASHLQKYRIFLKKVAERAAAGGAGAGSKNNPMRSSFASGHAAMLVQEAQEYAQIREKQQQMRSLSTYLPRYGAGTSSAVSFGPIRRSLGRPSVGFPSAVASTGRNNSTLPHQIGLSGNQSTFTESLLENSSNSMYSGTGGLLNNNRPCPRSINGYGTTSNAADAPVSAGIVMAPGKSSSPASVSASFAGFGGTYSGNYEYQPPQPFSGDNSSMLPPLTSQQKSVAPNEFGSVGSNSANPSVNAAGNFTAPQPDQGFDVDDLHTDPSQYQFLFQQQGGSGGCAMNNPNVASGSGTHQAAEVNQTQNPDLNSGAYNDVEENAPSPWTEPTLEQLQEIEAILNSESATNIVDPSSDNYSPSFEPNLNQQKAGSQSSVVINTEQHRVNDQRPSPNSSSGNQGWDDEFINSLFRDNPY